MDFLVCFMKVLYIHTHHSLVAAYAICDMSFLLDLNSSFICCIYSGYIFKLYRAMQLMRSMDYPCRMPNVTIFLYIYLGHRRHNHKEKSKYDRCFDWLADCKNRNYAVCWVQHFRLFFSAILYHLLVQWKLYLPSPETHFTNHISVIIE